MDIQNPHIEKIKQGIASLQAGQNSQLTQRDLLHQKLSALAYALYGYSVEEWMKPVVIQHAGILYTFAKNIECDFASQSGDTVTTKFKQRNGSVQMTHYTHALLGPPKRTFQPSSPEWNDMRGVYLSADTQQTQTTFNR